MTWATKPARGADPVSDSGAIAAERQGQEWDVTSLVNGNGQLDLALASTSTDGVEFLSKEATNAAKRPVLEVTFATPFDGTGADRARPTSRRRRPARTSTSRGPRPRTTWR